MAILLSCLVCILNHAYIGTAVMHYHNLCAITTQHDFQSTHKKQSQRCVYRCTVVIFIAASRHHTDIHVQLLSEYLN